MLWACWALYYNQSRMVQFLHLLMVVVLQGVHASPNFYRMELFGNQSLLYYYTQFYIGHPLQHQTILIDTGSFLSVIPCSHCIYCESERLASLYNLEQSRSGFELKCVMSCLNRTVEKPYVKNQEDARAIMNIASSMSTIWMAPMWLGGS